MHGERLLCTAFLPSLVLIGQVVFLLECGHTYWHTLTDVIGHPTHASATAGMGNNFLSQYETLSDIEGPWLLTALALTLKVLSSNTSLARPNVADSNDWF